MMLRRLFVVASLAAVLVSSAWAVDAYETAEPFKTSSAVHYRLRTPSVRALGADTAFVSIRLPDLPYIDLSGGPGWRTIVGVRIVGSAVVDSVLAEVWHGYDESQWQIYRSSVLANTSVYPGIPKAIDTSTIPLTAMRQLTVLITNADSTATAFDVEITLPKGR